MNEGYEGIISIRKKKNPKANQFMKRYSESLTNIEMKHKTKISPLKFEMKKINTLAVAKS